MLRCGADSRQAQWRGLHPGHARVHRTGVLSRRDPATRGQRREQTRRGSLLRRRSRDRVAATTDAGQGRNRRAPSAPHRVSLHAARIGAGEDLPALQPRAGQPALGPLAALLRLVAARLSSASTASAVAALQHHLPRPGAARPEAAASARNGSSARRSPAGCPSGGRPSAASMISGHWSCCSPPGVPKPSTACRRAAPSWARAWCAAACRGSRLFGRPGSSQNIWQREPRQKPRPGITGEDCSQPPDGVALTILPKLSMTSIWQVSPPMRRAGRRSAPRRRRPVSRWRGRRRRDRPPASGRPPCRGAGQATPRARSACGARRCSRPRAAPDRHTVKLGSP